MEFAEDIPQARALAGSGAGSCRFVALRPVVAYALAKEGVPYTTASEYGSWEDRFRIGLENFGKIRKITDLLDTELLRLPEHPTIRPGHLSFFHLKILYDVIQTKIRLLTAIIEAENPNEIIAFSRRSGAGTDFYPFNEDESVFAYLMELPGWRACTRIIPSLDVAQVADSPYAKTARRNLWQTISHAVSGHDLLFNIGIIGKKNGFGYLPGAIARLCLPLRKRAVIIYNSGYNWDYTLPEFLQSGIHPVIRLTDKNFGATPAPDSTWQAKCLAFCRGNPVMQASARFGEIDASPILFDRIASILSHTIPSCISRYEQGLRFFKEARAGCLLISTQALHGDRAVIRAAADMGMKIISWQHGGSGFCYHPMIVEAEFLHSDLHLVMGEGVRDSHLDTCRRSGCSGMPELSVVGSSWFDEERRTISRQQSPGGTTGPVLYITERFYFNMYYNSTPFDSTIICDHFWQVQQQFLGLAAENGDREFVFKFHPADALGEPVRSFAGDRELKNVRFVVQENTVQELVPAADAIIIDFVSTSVLEALVSDRPVFIYTGMFRMDDRPLALLRKRACVYDDFGELCAGIREFFSRGPAYLREQGADTADTEFIRAYGTYKHDGGSAARATRIVNDQLAKK